MLSASPTPYSSLPGMPMVNALPGGVPYGPWQQMYRAAPGAQLPSVSLPSLAGFGGPAQVVFQGTLGQAPTKTQMLASTFGAALVSAGVAAGFASTIGSSRPVLYPTLFMGGITLVGGILAILVANGKAEAAATP
jgi:hypothetical protein